MLIQRALSCINVQLVPVPHAHTYMYHTRIPIRTYFIHMIYVPLHMQVVHETCKIPQHAAQRMHLTGGDKLQSQMDEMQHTPALLAACCHGRQQQEALP